MKSYLIEEKFLFVPEWLAAGIVLEGVGARGLGRGCYKKDGNFA